MRWAIWGLMTLLLAGGAYGLGRFGRGARMPPALVATLPGDEAGFSREFDSRMRARFPIGSSEDALIAYLASEFFAPVWRRRNDANSSVLVLNGLIREKLIRVDWRADASGVLTFVSGAYESHCL